MRGLGRFLSPHVIEVTHEGKAHAHSLPAMHCGGGLRTRLRCPSYRRIRASWIPPGRWSCLSTAGRLLVIGGGIIGLEMACVYEALGAKVSVVELTAQLMPGCDLDLVRPLEKRLKGRYQQILLGTKVTAVKAAAEGVLVSFEDAKGASTQTFDRVLVAVGRVPNGRLIGAEAAGITVNERGFIPVDRQQRTNVAAYLCDRRRRRASRCWRTKPLTRPKSRLKWPRATSAHFDARVIPSVAYTDPEVAWVGLTELAAKAQGIAYEKSVFPWAASGRSLSLGRDEGLTKLLFDPATQRVLGGGIVGPNAGELVAEVALAIEMGADAADIGLTVHPHPTLSETVAMSAEAFEGTLTDLYLPKKSIAHQG